MSKDEWTHMGTVTRVIGGMVTYQGVRLKPGTYYKWLADTGEGFGTDGWKQIRSKAYPENATLNTDSIVPIKKEEKVSDLKAVRFWMVVGDKMGPPTKRHASRKAASDEARRLAACNRQRFYVLECVNGYGPVEPAIEPISIVEPPDAEA